MHRRAPQIGVVAQTIIEPKNMGIYRTFKKKLGPDPQDCARDANFKTTAKILENCYLWEFAIFRKIHQSELKLL